MRHILGPALLGTVLMAGCYSVNTVENAEKHATPQVVPDRRVVWDNTLAGKLAVGPVIESVVAGNLRHIQLEVTNQYAYLQKFVYQVEWYDQQGMKIDMPANGWKRLDLQAHETSTIAATAVSPAAVDFKIKFQEASGYNSVF